MTTNHAGATAALRQDDSGVPLWRRGFVGAGVAVAANAALWFGARAGDAALTVSLQPGQAPAHVGIGHVAAATIVTFTIGSLAFMVATRRSRRWALVVLGLAVLISVASAGAPLSADGAAMTRASLAAMHLVTGAAFLVTFGKEGIH